MTNITQLNFSDEELNSLCNSYGSILIIMCGIDGLVHSYEKKFLLSLITRAGFDGDNDILGKINHHNEQRLISPANLNRNHDHIRLFPIENIIFFELEKGICEIIDKLDKTKWKLLNKKDLLEKVEISLFTIKDLIDGKKEILGENLIHSFYNSLYNYCYKIAHSSGRGFSRNNILPEELEMLNLIKAVFNIDGVFNTQYIQICRKTQIFISI